jgi:PAS domain S-box-containing protein
MQQQLKSAHANPDILGIYVTDIKGAVLAEANDENRPPINSEVFRRAVMELRQWKTESQDNVLKVGGPVVLPDGSIGGYLFVELSLDRIRRLAEEESLAGLMLTTLALGIGAILAFVLAGHFTKPIRSIMEAATRIGAGDFSVRLKLQRNDEIGVLSDSINRMAESLESAETASVEANRTINALNTELEQRVIDRTKELESVNAALRESEARKQSIFETALDCIITTDDDGRILEFNRCAEITFGYSRDAVIGKRLADLLLPARAGEAPNGSLDDYLRSQSQREGSLVGKRVEITARRADGREFPIELTVTEISSGTRPIFTAFIRDISERKLNEEALHARFQEMQSVQEVSQTILAADNPKTCLQTILQKCVVTAGFDLGTILLTESDGTIIEVLAAYGYNDPANINRKERKDKKGSFSEVRSGQPFIVEDVQKLSGWRTLKKEGIRSAVAIPIMAGD